MNDHDFEQLSLFVDGMLPTADAARVAERVANDPEWKAAHRALKTTGEFMRARVDRAAKSANFDDLWAGIERGLAESAPVAPTLWDRLRGFLSPPVLVGLAAGVAAAAFVATRPSTPRATTALPAVAVQAPAPQPGSTLVAEKPAPPSSLPVEVAPEDSVIIEGVEFEGARSVLVSQPVGPNGATVIWMLDAPDGGAAPGSGTVTSDDDPI